MTDSKGTGDYGALGVSSDKAAVHKAVEDLDQGLFPGAFCTILPDDVEPSMCKVPHVDGVGTKLAVYYLARRAGAGPRVYRGAAWDCGVMNVDDQACAGTFLQDYPLDITSYVSRNTFRFKDEDLAELIEGLKEFGLFMTQQGVPTRLYRLGETADVPDLSRTLDIAYLMQVRMPRADVVDASRIRPGAFIVGIKSDGQAAWEKEPNSGIGSNGLTLARHALLCPDYRVYTETYAPEIVQAGNGSTMGGITSRMPCRAIRASPSSRHCSRRRAVMCRTSSACCAPSIQGRSRPSSTARAVRKPRSASSVRQT